MKAHRPKQQLPAELVADLMSAIRTFYADASAREWARDSHFIRDRVILWPATWLDKRGITLPTARYKEIILEVFMEVKRHGNTGHIAYWPAYLAKCVQERFKHKSDEIYQEGKNLRCQLESALTVAQHSTAAIDPIRAMAEARRDLLARKNQTKRAAKTQPRQLSFL